MPSSTSIRGIPYPLTTDAVSDYPAIAKAAAEKQDMHIQRGQVSIGIAANATTSTAVTFPNAFTDVPNIQLTADSPNPGSIRLSTVDVAKSTFAIRLNSTVAQTVKVNWVALVC